MAQEKPSGSGAYEMITPPNRLKAKVGPGKGIDPQVLQRAQSLVDNMAGDFEVRAVEEIMRIMKLADLAEQDEGTDRTVEMFRISHELKGQGGTFGYPLITKIGNSLCRYIESVDDEHPIDLAVVRAHASAMQVIAGQRIAGDGGDLEQQLIAELDRLVQKTLG